MIWAIRSAGFAAVAALLVAAFIIVNAGDEPRPMSDATISIHFSRFTTKELTVPTGQPITFTLENRDPIEHEWIVGTDDVHARHRTGTEPYHDQVPTEVTVRAFETKVTVVTFDKPGDYPFVCHLPGHEQYGMRGTIHVVE